MLRTKLLTDIREDKTTLFLDVIGIKVTRPTRKEFGPFTAYYRNLRFEFFGGEVLDVTCSGVIQKYIKLRLVKTLKPVLKSETSSNPDNEDWITPKVYTGTSDRENGLLQRIRKLFS